MTLANKPPRGPRRGYIAQDAAIAGAQERCAPASASLLTRRDVLRVFTGLAASAAFGGYSPDGVASMPTVPAAEIDIHCHVFNIRDLAAYAFAVDVVIANPVLKLLGAPLARFITFMIYHAAPGYLKEKRTLEASLAKVRFAGRIARNSDNVESMFKKGLVGFVDEYTTFGDNPSPQNSEDNDRFVELLFRTFLDGFVIGADSRPEAKRGKVRANVNALYTAMRMQLLTNRKLRAQFLKGIGPSAKAYVSQFILYWAPRLSNYRFQLTDELPTLYKDAKAPPRLVTPATLDITNWLKDSELDYQPLTMLQQAELLHLIALKERSRPLVHGFIGFDPWRYVDDTANNVHPNALEVVDTALTQHGFVGVKLYPPMGFRATGNTSRCDGDFLDKLTTNHQNLGIKLDAALDELYKYCLTHDVPIMAHSAASQGTSDDNAKCADPQYWKAVLDQASVAGVDYAKLRLNLSHFGGIWNFDGTPPSRKNPLHIAWTDYIVNEMMSSGKYPNLYTDIGDFSDILDRTQDESNHEATIIANLTSLLQGHDDVKRRIMYGSDWIFLGVEPDFEDYYVQMRLHLANLLSPADPAMSDFLWKNAARYLGLVNGTPTQSLLRLQQFYRDNNGDPAVLNAFLVDPV